MTIRLGTLTRKCIRGMFAPATLITLLFTVLLRVPVCAAQDSTGQQARLQNARLDDFDTNYVYILTSSVVGIGQQWYLNRTHPVPAPAAKTSRSKKS